MNTQNTAMTNRTPFLLPDLVTGSEFSQDELAEDLDGLSLGFQRIKIPGGGHLQFEVPGDDPDNPDYVRTLEGVIVHSHNSNACWPEGQWTANWAAAPPAGSAPAAATMSSVPAPMGKASSARTCG